MPDLASTVAAGLADYFQMVRGRIHELVDQLSDAQVWERPYPYGNSIGNLLLHLTGNLNYYIGAQIAGTGYIRHRDQEFTDRGKSKQQLLKDFDSALEMVVATIQKQSLGDWSAAYSAVGSPETKNRFEILLNCAAHAYHHVGQIIYLEKQLQLKAAGSAA
jgi:uncharacterized damage-inducible protein DinB